MNIENLIKKNVLLSAVDDDEFDKKYCGELDTVEKRFTFAEKLREALRHSECCTDSTDDSYAVDISISGSKTDGNEGIRYFQYFFFFLKYHSRQQMKQRFVSFHSEFDVVVAVDSF